MAQGWICSRCGCSNSPMSYKCEERCHEKVEIIQSPINIPGIGNICPDCGKNVPEGQIHLCSGEDYPGKNEPINTNNP